MKKVSQQEVKEHLENVGSPRVTIEPSFQTAIQKAVDFVNRQYPDLLRDVTDIFGQIDTQHLFGEYRTDAPHTIYINIPNIKSEVERQMAGASPQEIEKQVQQQIVKTLIHEATHKKEFSGRGHSEEFGPEQAEKAVEPYLDQISTRDIRFVKRASELTEDEIITFKDSHRSDRKIADICNLACAALNGKSASDYGTTLDEEAIIRFKDMNRNLGWKMADICNLACRAFHI